MFLCWGVLLKCESLTGLRTLHRVLKTIPLCPRDYVASFHTCVYFCLPPSECLHEVWKGVTETDRGVGSDETEKDEENKEKEVQSHDAGELWKGTKEEWRQQLNDLSFIFSRANCKDWMYRI